MEKITANDPEARSADVVAGNIAQLKALFPELVTEGKDGAAVNVDVLKQLVGDATLTDAEEKYGLNWHGKRRARQLALTPSLGTLRPCPEVSVDWDTTQNLMIEGDNLEVLKLLQKSYAGKVKLIYIDPPYNTGKDFVYPDNFQDSIGNYLALTGQVESGRKISSSTEATGRFHTDWLNMMYPRLLLARALLASDGFIAISIDDSEFANVRAICDEIFGSENFIGPIVRNTNSSKNQSQFISVSHDYAVFYAKDIEALKRHAAVNGPWAVPKNNLAAFLRQLEQLRRRGLSNDEITEEIKELVKRPRFIDFVNYWNFDEFAERGVYRKGDLGGVPNGNKTPMHNPLTGQLDPVPPGGFRFDSKKLKELADDGRIHFHTDGSLPTIKRYLRDNLESRPKSITSDDQRPDNALLKRWGIPFENPKQLAFMKRLLSLSQPDAIVLDFFAGSGTTAHALMEVNAEANSSRRFIAVQFPEAVSSTEFSSVAEMTRRRIFLAGAELRSSGADTDVGFRVLRLDQSNIRTWQSTGDVEGDLLNSIEHILPDRSEHDVLTELLLKLGLDLCVPIDEREIAGRAVHAVGGGVLMACLDGRIGSKDVEPLALGIAGWRQELNPVGDTTCVFRDSAFEDDEAKTNLAAILEQHGIRHVRSL